MFNDGVPARERVFHGPRLSLLVLGREEAEAFAPDVPYVVVSVADPERPEVSLAASPLCRGVLRLRFHDVVQASGAEVAMSAADARAVLGFVGGHLWGAGLVVCQCEAGVSRSAGLAAGLSRALQGEDGYFFQHYWPNRHVYRLLVEGAEARPGAGQGEGAA